MAPTPLNARDMAASLALGLVVPAQASEAPRVEPIIVVTGERSNQVALDRVPTSIVNTPQAITVLTSDELAKRGIANLNDALRNVAGLSLGAGETSFQGNNAVLRGFTTRNDMFVDNARDYGYYFRDTFDDERIEVIKGPSSTLFGRGSTGGVIHRVGKMPHLDTALASETRIGLDDTRRLTLDANLAQPFGDTTALRLNAVAHRSAVAARDGGVAERFAAAPKLAFGLGTPTRLTLAWLHQQENNRPDYGIPWVTGTRAVPGFAAPVDRRNHYGFTNDRLDTVVNILTGRIEHDFGAGSRLRGQLRYSDNSRDFRYSEATIPTGTPQSSPVETITASRNLFEGGSRDRFFQTQGEIETIIVTGAAEHHLLAGIEAGSEATDPIYVTNLNVPTTSLAHPDFRFFDSRPRSFVRLRAHARSRFVGAFALDTIAIGPHWIAILGLRRDSFTTRYDSSRFTVAGVIDRETSIERTDRRLSSRAALVYKPAASGRIYLAYANSFNPSGEGIESLVSAGRSVAEANRDLAPETSASLELGSKWNLFENRVLLAASLFRITKENVRVPDAEVPGFNMLGGKQRVDGFEVELTGQPLPGWSLRASYALLDSKTLQSSPGGPIVGAPLLIAPRHSGSFSTSYDVTSAFNLGLNIVGQSQRLAQNSGASWLVAGGYVVTDLATTWRATPRLTLRFLVNNITDKLYYDQLHPVHVIPGAGRTALLSVGFVL